MNKCHKLEMSSFQLVSLPAFHFQKSGDTDLMVSTTIMKLISALFSSTERLNNPPSSAASEVLPWCQCLQLHVFLTGGKEWGNHQFVCLAQCRRVCDKCCPALACLGTCSTFLALSLLKAKSKLKEARSHKAWHNVQCLPMLQNTILAGTLTRI